jgi:hypothetical protein
MVRQVMVGLAVVMFGVVLGANVYNSVVDATSWGANSPLSFQTARQYYASVNPGTFYRVVSPATQVAALVALILCWKIPAARTYAGAAFALSVAGDALTFGYFYPRNAIIFADSSAADAVVTAWREWSTMNHVRSALVLVALCAELVAMTRTAQTLSRA